MKYKCLILMFCFNVSACANGGGTTAVDYDDYKSAVNVGSSRDSVPVRLVPVPMPGQLMSIKDHRYKSKLIGEDAIVAANKKAMKHPSFGEYINSIMYFDYMPGALYQIYCAPLSVTDIQFQNNEHIISAAAGDTLRWQVSKTYSGLGAMKHEHLLIKPTEAGITNSLVVTTDRRTYHMMLHAKEKTYMASVVWRYPDSDDLITNLDDSSMGNSMDGDNMPTNISNLNFNYQAIVTKGPRPEWFPSTVFNDGSKTYIKFPKLTQEAPTLFVGEHKNLELVNYRVVGDYYVIDSLISRAQLCGGRNGQTTVQINSR